MKINHAFVFFSLVFCLALSGCSDTDQKNNETSSSTLPSVDQQILKREYAELPDNINWLTNMDDQVFSSPNAKKGGTFRGGLLSFPLTFRVVGPDSNSGFRSTILDNQLGLINDHPNTGNIIPELATHWAFDPDNKTMYFKLDKKAKWSDGHPVDAWDFKYTLEFMRSEHIIAPWYNDFYSREIDSVIVYDDHTLAVKASKAVPDLYMYLAIRPIAEHYYGKLESGFVHKYNWKIAPNTGAYKISDFKKGKYVKLKRKKDWWAKDNRYFKNRFNVDYVVYEVIRDFNLLWEHFKKGNLDVFGLTLPKYWHQKSKTRVFENGYVNKIWFFNDMERSGRGMFLNQAGEIFKDRQLCIAFAHAMNIEKVIEKVLRKDYFRLAQAFFGYGEYTDYTIAPRDYDIKKVEDIMTNVGWKRGKDGIWEKEGRRFSVKVTYSLEEHTPRIVVLKEDAQKAGVEIVLDKLDNTAAFKKILEKKHDVAWMAWSTNLRPSYWQGWHSDNANKTQTNNITNTDEPALDELIDQYRASLNAVERADLSKKIQKLIHETGAFVPTFMIPYIRQGYWRWVQLPEFHGTKRSETLFDPFNTSYGGLMWLDEKIKAETKKAMKEKKKFTQQVIKDEQFKVGVQN
ncbi:MAG: ABC transporter substrate-binding protein [Desulfobacteraceae bacterium]|nr:ABC transporter substrate-binding protein [Desulfobacteraceae bacterium]